MRYFFMWMRSLCKMGSSDLQEFATSHQQNQYERCSSALRLLSIMLMHNNVHISTVCTRCGAKQTGQRSYLFSKVSC
jgi:hypothetical protein